MADYKNFDFFRKIPRDLTQATRTGAGLSFFGVFCLTTLFIFELNNFATPRIDTQVVLDNSKANTLRVNFNITLPKVPCQFASVDVQDVLKTRKHNVTANIHKYRIDEETGEMLAKASHKIAAPKYGVASPQKAGKQHSQDLEGKDDFEAFVKGHDVAFVDFYAPWCIWCKRLHPVWEEASDLISNKYMGKVQFGKVDCTKPANADTCQNNHVRAYPTINIYRNHHDHSHEMYGGDRTVPAFLSHVERIYQEQVKAGQLKELPAPPSPDAQAPETAEEEKHAVKKGTYSRPEGCIINGFLDLHRVPGSVLITVDSKGHSFDMSKVNLTHIVHDFSYGTPLDKYQKSKLPQDTVDALSPLSGEQVVSKVPMQTHEHYLKVVSSQFEFLSGDNVNTYTYTRSSHSYEDGDKLAAAKFTFDLSPMSLVVKEQRQPLYKFLTSVCAIIGGVFTVIGLIDSMVYHSLRTLKKKMELGKAN